MRKLGRIGRAVMLAVAVVGTAFAQTEKPTIALYIANDKLNTEEKNFLTSKFLRPFTASGLYSVVDRSNIFTQKAAVERIKQRDGSVNENEIYKIGYEAGAKYVCIVELNGVFGRWNIAARMVDVVTAKIYLSQGETDIKGNLEDADFSGAAKTIFNQIHGNSGDVSQTPSTTVPPAVVADPQPKYQSPAPTPISTIPKPINYGSLRDSRDGKTYKTVVIGGKTWMAENINIKTGTSWCYDNNNSNCDKYGRLYNWKTAKTVCPSGYHLPSSQEWDNLATAVGGKDVAGKKLKARSGWSWNSNGNGTDEYGFSALPGGRRNNGYFDDAGNNGYWWTATWDGGNFAHFRYMYYDYVLENYYNKSHGQSVRCVSDN